ncbi:hypothetical protein OSB04_016777 [Centaurea solstitialis]|uniref:Reverse transcriptase Ty1/copia-type domain-containing protein n=1 Tax=Centaurea solstitialis TaxID=347529 RepID=A0AA38TJS3_9ASTR|nr:hypothetical protein OSB04_016777 [Centaurea solstitialis]
MSQPEGFIAQGKENYVYKLKNSLYRLKQSSREWYKCFDTFMVTHGFSRSPYDCCIVTCKISITSPTVLTESKSEQFCHGANLRADLISAMISAKSAVEF